MKQLLITIGVAICLFSSCGSSNTQVIDNGTELQLYSVDSPRTIHGTIVSGTINEKKDGSTLVLITSDIRGGSTNDTVILGQNGFYETEAVIFRKMLKAKDSTHSIKAEFVINNSDSKLYQYPAGNKFALWRSCGCEEINFTW